MRSSRSGTAFSPGSGAPPEQWRTAAGRGVVDTADWSAPPPGSVRGYFSAPSGRLATLSMGPADGESIVLVPGVTGSKEDFSLMMPRLAGAGYRVLSYDLAGQYESFAAGPENVVPPREQYDYDLFVDDLIAILDSRGAPSHVLGYSFAGIVTQLALARRPDRFASLTLMSCPPEPGQALRGVPVLGRVSGGSSSRFDAALMIWAIRCNISHVPPSRLRFMRHRFTLTRRSSVTDVFELMKHAPDLRETVRSAPIPKLVAVGEHDVWPLELHRRFAADIGARLSVYPGGHSPCETSPIELSDDLLDLIRDRRPEQERSQTPGVRRTDGATTTPRRNPAVLESLPGIGISLGAAAGLSIGFAIAGTPGIALGAAVGAALGLAAGAMARTRTR